MTESGIKRREARKGSSFAMRRAAIALDTTIRAGAIQYDRGRHLPRLIRAVPSEIAGSDPRTARAIIARLARALASERRRGRSGHWSYDMNRHIALKQALTAELTALAKILGATRLESSGSKGDV